MTTFLLNNRMETQAWGLKLGSALQAGDVIALIGDLGAGKTTLTQGIARGMGITAPVTSPTYTLMQEYPGLLPLFHADPYRLENPEEIFSFGFEEYFERGGVVIIEWADKIAPLLPPDILTLTLSVADEPMDNDEAGALRLLTAAASGPRSLSLLKTMQNGAEMSITSE